jgi:hypothetical protein
MCGSGRRGSRVPPARVVGEDADLLERTRIEEPVDALTRRELSPLVLPADALLPAHLSGEREASLDHLDFGLPAHDSGGAIAITPASASAAARASG